MHELKETFMGKIDIATKQYMSHRDIIADAFNFYIYDGRQVIKPEELQKIDTAEIALPYGNDADMAVQKLRDNLMLWSMAKDDEAVYVVLGIENQDKIHYAIAVKNMLYDALQYAKQVEEAKRSYRDRSKKKHARSVVNQQISNLLSKNGISISKQVQKFLKMSLLRLLHMKLWHLSVLPVREKPLCSAFFSLFFIHTKERAC